VNPPPEREHHGTNETNFGKFNSNQLVFKFGEQKDNISYDKYSCEKAYREHLDRVTSKKDAGRSEMRKFINVIYNGRMILSPLLPNPHQHCKNRDCL